MDRPTFNLVADTICRTTELGLAITDACGEEFRTTIDAVPIDPNPYCPGCGHPGKRRDYVYRQLVDLPVVGGAPPPCGFGCPGSGVWSRPARIRSIRRDWTARPRSRRSPTGSEPDFVTVLVDLTPVYEGTGPARLVDMVPGRSATALKRWLSSLPATQREQIKVVTMDGFAGYATAVDKILPGGCEGHGPVPRGAPSSGQAHRVSAACSAGHHGPAGGRRKTRCIRAEKRC